MKKEYFTNNYSDVYEQTMVCEYNMARVQYETMSMDLCNMLKTGLLGYYVQDKTVHVFTSNKMLEKLNKMIKGAKVVDLNGFEGIITSEKPFMCCGKMAIRVLYPDGDSAYSCDFYKSVE